MIIVIHDRGRMPKQPSKTFRVGNKIHPVCITNTDSGTVANFEILTKKHINFFSKIASHFLLLGKY